MGIIRDSDRNLRRENAAAQTENDARIANEARTILLATFAKIGNSIVELTRKEFSKGNSHGVASVMSDEFVICHPHDYIALEIHKQEPRLLIDTLDRILDMSHGKDYDWLHGPPDFRIMHDVCGWDSGLKMRVVVRFTPPLT